MYLNSFLSYFEMPLSPEEAEIFIIDTFANVKQLFPTQCTETSSSEVAEERTPLSRGSLT